MRFTLNLKKGGVLSLEDDVTNPMSSDIFTKYKSFSSNHHAVDFFCDALKMIVNGACDAEELEILLETEMETHHEENTISPALINRISDAMPGLGIVAAVLGIIVTMQHLDGPPEELGKHVGASSWSEHFWDYCLLTVFYRLLQLIWKILQWTKISTLIV